MTEHTCKLLPYKTILAATKGDPLALSLVEKRYSGYMKTLCKIHSEDISGNVIETIDEHMYSRLAAKLAEATLRFRAEE